MNLLTINNHQLIMFKLQAKDSKDTGGIHDFVEILKLYDKNEDNTILGKELFRLLTNLGQFKSIFRQFGANFESSKFLFWASFFLIDLTTLFPLPPFRREVDEGGGEEVDGGLVRAGGRRGIHAIHA